MATENPRLSSMIFPQEKSHSLDDQETIPQKWWVPMVIKCHQGSDATMTAGKSRDSHGLVRWKWLGICWDWIVSWIDQDVVGICWILFPPRPQRSVADAFGPTSKKVDGFLYLDGIREKTVSRWFPSRKNGDSLGLAVFSHILGGNPPMPQGLEQILIWIWRRRRSRRTWWAWKTISHGNYWYPNGTTRTTMAS